MDEQEVDRQVALAERSLAQAWAEAQALGQDRGRQRNLKPRRCVGRSRARTRRPAPVRRRGSRRPAIRSGSSSDDPSGPPEPEPELAAAPGRGRS